MSTLLNLPKYFDSEVGPRELKQMTAAELAVLAARLRQDLINSVSRTGGHLSSNLGIVELTLALHKVFDSPKDKLIWDVGHQTYVHKMITGRKSRFDTLRQFKGLSGFVTPQESLHDSFVAGHSSTSISLAVGMAIARDRRHLKHKIVAIIGDGSLTGGMALEALNHLGHIQKDVIIVLNDNGMSISENLGGFCQYLKSIKETFFWNKTEQNFNSAEIRTDSAEFEPDIWNRFSRVKKAAGTTEERPGTVFEKLGIEYNGPVDGHDLNALTRALEAIKDKRGPQLVHVVTQKGRGYAPAEADSVKYHGIGAFPLEKTEPEPSNNIEKEKTYSQIFAEALIEIGDKEPDLVAITPATGEGTGLVEFAKVFPDRFFDVAICEQHAVTMAAAMAASGLLPVVSIYSTFLQRAMDQVIHDTAILNLPVIFGIDRGGLVEDGQTHQGLFDISYMRAIPNMRVYAPRNAAELRNMVYTLCQEKSGPAAIRFPRDIAPESEKNMPMELIDINRWEVLIEGDGPVLLAFGSMVATAQKCMDRLHLQGLLPVLVNARSAKPLDAELLEQYLKDRNRKIITLEEGAFSGGFGSSVLEFAAQLRLNQPGTKTAEVVCLAIPDYFIEHGARSILLDQLGLSPAKICEKIKQFARS